MSDCDHKYSLDLRLGYDGSLWYKCRGCQQVAKVPVKTLRKMVVRRLNRLQAGGKPYDQDDNTPYSLRRGWRDDTEKGFGQSA